MFSGVLFDYVSPGADDAAKRGAEGFMADNVTLSIGGFPEFADGFPELLGADSAMICFPTPTTGASLLPRSGKFPRLLWQIVQAGVQDGILNWTPDGTHVLYGNTPNNVK